MATKDSSYANVVVHPQASDMPKKPTKDEIINDNNKENISVKSSPTSPATKSDPVESPAANVKSDENPSSQNNHNEPDEIVDDSEFTPVVGDKKKDRKSRQKKHDRKSGDGPKHSKSSQDRSDKERERPEKPRRSRKERKASKDAALVADSTTKDKERTDGENTADSSDGQTDKVKFVEAPLPKVNAWKVRIFISYSS